MRKMHHFVKENISTTTLEALKAFRHQLAISEHYRYLAYLEREKQIAEGKRK